MSKAKQNHCAAWISLTGALPFRMTNDFLFKILLQTDNDVLKAIICAYLDMNPEEVKTVRITNAITLKEDSASKEMILDIRAEMNDDSIINLEMQVQDNHDWPERSISYLCRCFDNLQKGQGYIHVKGAVHIGFLDYTLFPGYPEFYATYRLRNERTGQLYSSKFRISVVDLTQIKLATEEDKRSHRNLWAAFFKATSWTKTLNRR
jgi:predicted transposase/invertase (TIGR01784 family)